jgi:peptidoglycan/xylan/chitin deacetylase (PgdA/CDA1 family)
MYHRVLPAEEVSRRAVEPGMYVTPGSFARQLSWLEARFRVLPLHELVARFEQRRALPRSACAITFDDGWRDNYTHALPELARRGLPATVFVVTERVGTEGSFWPDEVCLRMAPLSELDRRRLAAELGAVSSGDAVEGLLGHMKDLSELERGVALDELRAATEEPPDLGRELLHWDELDRLSRAGIDVESHGATHAILTGLPDEQVERELRSARETLLERGHGRHALLAYPSGAHDDRVSRIARGVGYRAGFTVERGLAHEAVDRMALPRLSVHEDISHTRAEFLLRVPGST